MHGDKGIVLDDEAIEEKFVFATGPGGQHVNKNATAVQLRYDLAKASSLSDAAKVRLKSIAGRRLNRYGILVIEARRFRERERNRADARARLMALLHLGQTPQKPRIRTKVSVAQKRKRLDDKKKRSEIKARRSRPFD